MDFMQLLRSFQDMLYEVMSWLVFYPRTLWRVVTSPGHITSVSDAELSEPAEQQYTDMLAPPLFLLLSILLAHGIEQLVRSTLPEVEDGGLLVTIASSSQNLLFYRAVIFSLLPLIAAVEYLTRRGLPMDRATLKHPFFSQCYLAGPFVLSVGIGNAASGLPDARFAAVFVGIGLLGLLWYASAVIAWYRRTLGTGWAVAALVGLKVLGLAALTHATLSSLLSIGTAS
jgi:hypothetical protein